MGDFFAELKRRHIYCVAAAYAVYALASIGRGNNRSEAPIQQNLGKRNRPLLGKWGFRWGG
jgi:hypothetical protein